MKIVHDRAEARWLPSRCHFALMRLVAFVILRRAKPRPAPGLRVIVQRGQNAIEQHAVSIWVSFTVIAYLATVLSRWMAWPLAVVIAIVIGGFAVEIPYLALGVLLAALRLTTYSKVLAVAYMTLLLIASSYFATTSTPARFVAYFALMLFALNALAAMVLFALRGAVRQLEERCGA